MLTLKLKKREIKDKAKNILKTGSVPGVVYGPKMSPEPVSVDKKRFFDTYKKAGETTLISLDFGDDEKEKDHVVLIREVQKHPVSGNFTHVDFYELPMDQEIEISVPVISINEAPAVKQEGGVLVHNLHEIDIKALPKNLIHEITVDLSVLENIGDAILVKDLGITNEVEILADSEETVFLVEEPREEEVVEEEATEGEEEKIAEIKTEGEEKREEREAEEAAEGENPEEK
ncbi:MAG: 50S ribosomal protein L25 [Candidatus Spechtbacterales bacterium]